MPAIDHKTWTGGRTSIKLVDSNLSTPQHRHQYFSIIVQRRRVKLFAFVFRASLCALESQCSPLLVGATKLLLNMTNYMYWQVVWVS